ncbi:hypothetical protein AMELA_G00056510 [Ameiurus melas]|uniref:Uncharacterized protein n=1 Tax=Ameiurus melas TaxID=219545 RepID=A0A7J6B8J7_AMEME|nr:hypothetical protein AMELA_G00056510 [Ameiurus melas]
MLPRSTIYILTHLHLLPRLQDLDTDTVKSKSRPKSTPQRSGQQPRLWGDDGTDGATVKTKDKDDKGC